MRIERALDRVNLIPVLLASAAVGLMMVHVCIDVIGKFIFNMPAPATITVVTEYYMPILTFLPIAYVHRRTGHISVEVLTASFPKRVQFHLHYAGLALSLAVFCLLAFATLQEALTKYKVGAFALEQDMQLPTWPGYFLPTIGYGLIALLIAWELSVYLRGRASASRFE